MSRDNGSKYGPEKTLTLEQWRARHVPEYGGDPKRRPETQDFVELRSTAGAAPDLEGVGFGSTRTTVQSAGDTRGAGRRPRGLRKPT